MWRFEWKKLWGNKAFMGILVACFLLNGAFLCWEMERYSEKTRCFPNEITKVYEEVAKVPREEVVEWIQTEAENELKAEVPNRQRHNALLTVASHMKEALDYEGYLDRMEKQANQIAHSSLFSDADEFSKRNAAEIVRNYEHLHGLVLKPENPQGFLTATESNITTFFWIVIVLMFSYFVICVEREEGTMAFVHCTANGAKRLGMVKAAVVLVGNAAGTVILYGINFLFAGIKFGYGDLGRWIQSVDGYMASPWKMSVGAGISWFFVGKILVTLIVSVLVIWILLKSRGVLEGSVALLGIVAVEYLLYRKIEMASWFGILKQCNLFYLMDTERFLKNYYTVNLFSYPVSSLFVCGLFGIVVFLVFSVQSLRCYETVSRSEYTMKSRKWKLPALQKEIGKYNHLWQYEAKKILSIHRAGILFLVFLTLLTVIYHNKEEYFSEDELYYRYYIGQVEGKVTEKRLRFLKDEGKHIQDMLEEWQMLSEQSGNMNENERIERLEKLELQLKCTAGYERVLAQAERIGEDGMFLDEVAFGRLLDKSELLKNIGMLLVLFVLAFYPVFMMDSIAGMDNIWNTIPNGRKKIQMRKWTVIVIYIVMACVLSDVIFILYETKLLKISDLSLPIQYLTGFAAWREISVQAYLMGRCCIKIFLGIAVAAVTALVSRRAKNVTTVLLVMFGMTGICYIIGSILYMRYL